MELIKCFCLFIELMVVINSSYSYVPRGRYTATRNRASSIIPRQCETPLLINGSARLRQRGKLIRYLCLPSYTLVGDKYSSCINGQWENPVPMCIKPGCASIVPPENGFTIVEKNGALTMMFCRPGYLVAGSQKSFCNGTSWDRSLGSCRETQTSPARSCDFEVASICDWEADPSHDFEWVRKNGYTSAKQLQTGPRHDNTVGIPLEGHFMLATFASQAPHSVARLISPLYPAEDSKDACFRFYYHMFGAITGVLRVYIKPESVTMADMFDSAKYLFMEKNGSYENAWLESVFDIDQYDQDFQIIIEATAIRTTRSNIAIDDVALLSGADCINEELKSTAVTEEEDGIFDAQSCVNRCLETEPYSPYATQSTRRSLNKTFTILNCDCYDGCVDRKSCCLDYISICVFVDNSTPFSEPNTAMISSTNVASKTTVSLTPTTASTTFTPTTTPTSTLKSTITTVPTTTVIPTTKALSTAKTIPILTTKVIATTKASPTTKLVPTTRTMPTTKTVPTTVTTSTAIPTVKLITVPTTTSSTTIATTSKTTTKKLTPRKIVTSTSTTTKKTAIIFTTKSTTPIVPITSTTKFTSKTTTSTKSTGSTLRIDEWHPVNTLTDTDPLPSNLLTVFGIALLIAVILALSITAFRFYQKHQSDRFNYKSNSKRYFKDASDEVRFLTADEQLDFTMQAEDNCR